jgi:hypothetical protein
MLKFVAGELPHAILNNKESGDDGSGLNCEPQSNA